MADRRRRRRRASQDSDDDDDDESGSSSGSEIRESGSQTSKGRGGREPEPAEVASERIEAKEEVASECESEDGAGEAVLSDYDSADPEENASHSEGGEEEEGADGFSDKEAPAAASQSKLSAPAQPAPAEANEDREERSKVEKESEEKGKSAGERQSGDGQESTEDPETKAGGQSGQQLDDDEDRKNPAYIPRKGLFFEHDVRGHAQEEERPKGRNRKLWKDEGRWEHDKFREEEQAPKSREELIASYGYDIRNGERTFVHRRPRSSVSPNREPWWRDGGERAVRSWQSGRGGRGGGSLARGGPPHRAVPLVASQRGNTTRGRPPHLPAQPQYGGSDSHAPLLHPRERVGPKAPPVPAAAGRGSRRAAEDPPVSKDGEDDRPLSTGTQVAYRSTSPTQQLQEKRGGAAQPPHASVASQEASPPAERPVERKSYSLARRSRSRPAELGGKQTSVEEVAVAEVKNPVGGGGMAELDQDVARLSLVSGQSWNQNPASYVHSEIRSLRGGLPIPSGRPPFSGLDEMSGGSNRAKRYSSQRQRGVAEAAPLHIGVMEGHYYEPMTYQGPIFTHGEASAPVAPQGILVQPEMHIPHPGLHPHQSGGPIANPALYGGPPVSLPPGQPQQLLPPPFYPPPGVMTFPYPAMYPSPQGQSQVTYGGVTYYDTMQQQAQPKPSPPRRTSQPVTVKPPPPEVPFALE
ncbi:protein CASC3 isoform X1 [Phyllopteryx taeniolatus]|uniref:protein CASC3 isoform X1 n=1 Tax=Phyllopteryx taeniolatus TaxID=161469 RepID=UPI002AD4F278|nr:protein CASC3 isoform X1 [Phyllopteryx taeniolatus]